MKPIEITNHIYWIGVNDTTTRLFEGLWLIEKAGISYNSYLIKDGKTVLIDLCKEIYQDEYLHDLETLVDPAEIDYLVVNHMEPDHTGALRAFHARAPQATILATQKAVRMLADFCGITDNIQVVGDGEKISIDEKELTFITAPMVHWPETMLTYEAQSGILFSCDAFGGYGKLSNGIFDDDYADISMFERESLRYFANIVAAFSKPVLNAAEKLGNITSPNGRTLTRPCMAAVSRADHQSLPEMVRVQQRKSRAGRHHPARNDVRQYRSCPSRHQIRSGESTCSLYSPRHHHDPHQ